jgi:uncharacterized protein (TIGR02118 family)
LLRVTLFSGGEHVEISSRCRLCRSFIRCGSSRTKVTVLYGQPKNTAEFDKYYADTHMPMVYAVKEVKRVEISKPLPPPTGGDPPYYILTELWFDSLDTFKAVAATPEWKAISADVPKFATGGATPFVSVIETKR